MSAYCEIWIKVWLHKTSKRQSNLTNEKYPNPPLPTTHLQRISPQGKGALGPAPWVTLGHETATIFKMAAADVSWPRSAQVIWQNWSNERINCRESYLDGFAMSSSSSLWLLVATAAGVIFVCNVIINLAKKFLLARRLARSFPSPPKHWLPGYSNNVSILPV